MGRPVLGIPQHTTLKQRTYGAGHYKYTTAEVEGKAVVEPTEALAPTPPEVSCAPKLEKGCRALTFNYATTTTATGENASQWGDYKGRLTRVYYNVWEPTAKEVKPIEVAHYAYDTKGRLRAEWDPRISPALKTVYGYDSEGHLTAITPPGQETWALTYGTISGDPSTGRLVKVTHAPASAKLWGGEAPKDTEAPKISGSPVVGNPMAASSGVWSNEPVADGYQWEDCNSSGSECVAIGGATNANYTPAVSDVGHKLVMVVTATNGGGSVAVTSAASAEVKASEAKPVEGEHHSAGPGWTIEYRVPLSGSGLQTMTEAGVKKWGQEDDPTEGMAIIPPDKPMGWPASEYEHASIDYLDAEGRTVDELLPSGGISTSEYNATNEVVRTLSADDRASALKEPSESKSREAAKLLSTESTYSGEGQLTETLGPQHKVKLAAGSEVLARNHVKYSYDEGAPETGGPYSLVTKTTDGALLPGGEEKDVRSTITSYSGQKGLGWKLRKPTSTTTDLTGLDLTHTTEYSEVTGNVVEAKAPAGTSQAVYPPVFSASFGSEGSGNGDFNHPEGVAVDSSGNVWVVDKNNNRVEKFSAAGSFSAAYGSSGLGDDEFSGPWGIAISPTTGNVYISDTNNNRIEELSSTGAFVEAFGWGVSNGKAELEACETACKAGISGSGNGQLDEPLGLTIDSHGNVWVADGGNNRVQEFSATGGYVGQFGSKGSGAGQLLEPLDVTISEGELYVTDFGNNRVQEFSTAGLYLAQFGGSGSGEGQLKEPTGITANATSGDLYVSDTGNNRVQEFSPAGKFLAEFGYYGTGNDEFHAPTGLAISASGELYIADQYNARVQEWLPPGTGGVRLLYSTQFGSGGTSNGQFNFPSGVAIDGHGDAWVSDYGNNRVQEFTAKGTFIAAYGSSGSGNGQFKGPTGIAVNQSTGNVYIGDCGNSRIEELSSSGAFVRAFGSPGSEPGQLGCPAAIKIDASGNVWVADPEHNRIEEFSATGTFTAAYGSKGSGNGQFDEPDDLAFVGSDIYVADYANNRIEELSDTGTYIGQFASEGSGSGQLKGPEGITADSAGNLYVVDDGNDRIEEFSSAGHFLGAFGAHGSGEGQLNNPEGIAINAAGEIYISDSGNNRVELWMPDNQAAHDAKTIYYTKAANSEYPTCGEHVEWENLPCETTPVAQPEDKLDLPVTTITYNIWDEPETTEEKFGATSRTKKLTYDSAGRELTSEVTSTGDTALPKITNEYNSETGALVKQTSTKAGEETKTVTSSYNTLGELVKYTDADGNTSTYTYDEDGRVEEMSDGKGSQIYAYSPSTGQLTKLWDSAAGTFTATYDAEGKMLTEGYPNGMTATYTYNLAGETTGLEYEKKTHCTSSCTWFSDTQIPSIHGEVLSQTSSLSSEIYTYDTAGRLTQVQETPTGQGCKTSLYTYDEESNQTSLTSIPAGTEGKCSSEGGTTERHTYDEANHLTDEEVVYDPFGNTTKLPASDAGGHELKSTYYADNQLATQSQNGKTIEYTYDPAGRTRKTVTGSTTVISHYAGPGEGISWTSESAEKWTRNVPGIGGELAAVQNSGETPVLELHDLHGNIIATAALSETETKLLTTYNSTTFGVPSKEGTPPPYAWLGASGLKTELPTGIATKSGATYVPQIARDLQTEPITPPGPTPNGTPGPSYTAQVSPGLIAAVGQTAEQIYAEVKAAEQRAEEQRAEEQRAEEASIPEGWEEEGESILSYLPLEYGGDGAHAAGHIECEVAEGNGLPHSSSHNPGLVNWTIVFACNAPVPDVRVRLALFWEGKEVSETGYVEVGATAYWKESVQSSCLSGWYTGWAYVELTPPPGYEGERVFKSWSKASRYVDCES